MAGGGDHFLLYCLALYIALKIIKGRRLFHIHEGMYLKASTLFVQEFSCVLWDAIFI